MNSGKHLRTKRQHKFIILDPQVRSQFYGSSTLSIRHQHPKSLVRPHLLAVAVPMGTPTGT